MYEYKTKKWALNTLLEEMYWDGYRLAHFDKETQYSIWDKEIKRTNNAIIEKESPEYLEFIKAYRKINNKWSYDNRLIAKYHKVIKKTPHKNIIENLKDYKLFLEVNKTRKSLQAWPYLSGSRYLDKWEVVSDMSKKFVNDIYKEKELNKDEISYMNTEIDAYELKHKKEVTDWVVRNIIEVRLNK